MANIGLSCGQAIHEDLDRSGYGEERVDGLSYYMEGT